MINKKNDLDLGQHFMIDEDLLKKIISISEIKKDDAVLEIGSGKGALSKYLLEKTENLICVEKDTRLKSPSEKASFYQENILNIIEKLDFDIVIANIPYHLSEPLFKKFIQIKPKKIILVVGDTFANKLLDDSIIGVITREVYDVEKIVVIEPISFNPQPKVRSALIKLTLKKSVGILNDFFTQRDKKTKNYILKIFENKLTKKETKKLLDESKLSFEDKKLYTLSTEEFFELLNFIKEVFEKFNFGF